MTEKDRVFNQLRQVKDPEIPVLDVVEMGIVRDVSLLADGVKVSITPTYSGCPAMEAIEKDIQDCLKGHGHQVVTVTTVYAPPWTTDWMTEEARDKLKNYGIAPPQKSCAAAGSPFEQVQEPVACPFCESADTELRSRFGSTACKALHFCNHCRQPFEHFKCF